MRLQIWPQTLAAALILCTSVEAFCLTHIAREGETLKQLAVRYYGRPDMSMVIRAANGFLHPDDGSLTQGEQVEIPEASFYKIRNGDTWAEIANQRLASPQRGRFLANMNDYEKKDMPPPGTIIKIPYHLRHIFAGDETLKSVTKLYFGKKRTYRWLKQYNLTRKKRFKKFDIVIVPLLNLTLTKEEQERIKTERAENFTDEDIENQKKTIKEITKIRKMFKNGLYVKMVATAQRLIGRGKLTVPQKIGVHKFLGSAYVALEERQLAIESFIKALSLQPAMELSPITTSPKILEAFHKARKAVLSTSETKTASASSKSKVKAEK
ncbi:MAG: hypothetical protein GY847_37650 [Proteobacteria bacterium]|nr:hypothetical protein [Pseudomonadota bacterium]